MCYPASCRHACHRLATPEKGNVWGCRGIQTHIFLQSAVYIQDGHASVQLSVRHVVVQHLQQAGWAVGQHALKLKFNSRASSFRVNLTSGVLQLVWKEPAPGRVTDRAEHQSGSHLRHPLLAKIWLFP